MGKFTKGLKNAIMEDSDVQLMKLAWKGAKKAGGGIAYANEKHKDKKKKNEEDDEIRETSSIETSADTTQTTQEKTNYSLEDHSNDKQDVSGNRSDSFDDE